MSATVHSAPAHLDSQPTKQSTPTGNDFLPLKGTDHVEFYVGNARQAAYFYRTAFGMSLVAYAGPETGQRDRASYVVQQGKIRFVFTTPLRGGNLIAEHINECIGCRGEHTARGRHDPNRIGELVAGKGDCLHLRRRMMWAR